MVHVIALCMNVKAKVGILAQIAPTIKVNAF